MAASTYPLRAQLVAIARKDVGRVEEGKNQGLWIKKLWPATSYGAEGYADHQPYCAAGMAYCLREWLKSSLVRRALQLPSEAEAERWRCKSAAAFGWRDWAKAVGAQILSAKSILHAGDLVIYTKSHIEMVTDDDGTSSGPFVAIGYNTNAAGSRDGEGCFEKPRSRTGVREFIRILP